ncbi:MAG TPA: hypothetical protein VN625_01320 [Desulfuromonadaceae bacterium]|nr:hypothetical protein [Desulfuromonadaceae bacterium]
MASPAIPILLGGLLVWGVYRRIRRNIGRQRLRLRRILPSLTIVSLMGFFLVALFFQDRNLMLGFGSGCLLGCIAGFFGLKLTKFETNDEGHFYIPNTRIGVALSLLLAGRLLYKFIKNRDAFDLNNHSTPPVQSPLTFFIIGLTVGYYIVYYIGLFIHAVERKKRS